MNIKNRLKKIEETLALKNPTAKFCECFRKRFHANVRNVYDNEPFNEAEFTVPETDYCHKCRKPVAQLDLDVIEKINRIYGDLEI